MFAKPAPFSDPPMIFGPHAQHQIEVVERTKETGDRMVVIQDVPGLGHGRLGFTGEELDALVKWWKQEKKKRGRDQ